MSSNLDVKLLPTVGNPERVAQKRLETLSEQKARIEGAIAHAENITESVQNGGAYRGHDFTPIYSLTEESLPYSMRNYMDRIGTLDELRTVVEDAKKSRPIIEQHERRAVEYKTLAKENRSTSKTAEGLSKSLKRYEASWDRSRKKQSELSLFHATLSDNLKSVVAADLAYESIGISIEDMKKMAKDLGKAKTDSSRLNELSLNYINTMDKLPETTEALETANYKLQKIAEGSFDVKTLLTDEETAIRDSLMKQRNELVSQRGQYLRASKSSGYVHELKSHAKAAKKLQKPIETIEAKLRGIYEHSQTRNTLINGENKDYIAVRLDENIGKYAVVKRKDSHTNIALEYGSALENHIDTISTLSALETEIRTFADEFGRESDDWGFFATEMAETKRYVASTLDKNLKEAITKKKTLQSEIISFNKKYGTKRVDAEGIAEYASTKLSKIERSRAAYKGVETRSRNLTEKKTSHVLDSWTLQSIKTDAALNYNLISSDIIAEPSEARQKFDEAAKTAMFEEKILTKAIITKKKYFVNAGASFETLKSKVDQIIPEVITELQVAKKNLGKKNEYINAKMNVEQAILTKAENRAETPKERKRNPVLEKMKQYSPELLVAEGVAIATGMRIGHFGGNTLEALRTIPADISRIAGWPELIASGDLTTYQAGTAMAAMGTVGAYVVYKAKSIIDRKRKTVNIRSVAGIQGQKSLINPTAWEELAKKDPSILGALDRDTRSGGLVMVNGTPVIPRIDDIFDQNGDIVIEPALRHNGLGNTTVKVRPFDVGFDGRYFYGKELLAAPHIRKGIQEGKIIITEVPGETGSITPDLLGDFEQKKGIEAIVGDTINVQRFDLHNATINPVIFRVEDGFEPTVRVPVPAGYTADESLYLFESKGKLGSPLRRKIRTGAKKVTRAVDSSLPTSIPTGIKS